MNFQSVYKFSSIFCENTNMDSMDDVLKSLENDIQAFEKMFQELEPESKSECPTGVSIRTQGKPPLMPKPFLYKKTEKPKISPKPNIVQRKLVKFRQKENQFGTEV